MLKLSLVTDGDEEKYSSTICFYAARGPGDGRLASIRPDLKFFANTIAFRYRLAAFQLSSLLSSNDWPIIPLEKSNSMKNEKLKPTTVRFRDSDLDRKT